jgi:hypothetical protein
MMAVMISPSFLSDAIGYCVKRLFYTANEIVDRQKPDTILRYINVFHVACPDTDTPAVEQRRWVAYAAQHSWPLYPPAGAACFNPDRDIRGVIGLKVFNVACPVIALSAADLRRWVAYTTTHDWAAYP